VSTCLLVVTGAPLASRCSDIAEALSEAGWQIEVVTTPSAGAWVDEATVSHLNSALGHGETSSAEPDVVVVAPATFNTVAKLAAGIADTYAHSRLCEALGQRIPMVLVPMINNKLWGHPALEGHLHTLAEAGVALMDCQTGRPEARAVSSGTGDEVVERFDPSWIVARLLSLTSGT
jgi:phosphopantothenoylcysteine synthetase/decarboxylase